MQNKDKKTFPSQLVPWQIWVTTGALGLEGMNNFFLIFNNPIALLWLAAKVVFIIGLLKKWKWVYIIFLAVTALHVVFFAISGLLPISLINLALIILALWPFRYYFPKECKSTVDERPVI